MEADLIRRAQRGDTEAIRTLYERYADRVYSVTRRLAGDDATAEDWAQEAWLRAFRALPDFRGESRFSTWLHRIAVNSALLGDRSARRRRERVVQVEVTPEVAAREEKPLVRIRLERALDRLPEGMRRILVLHDVEGYTHDEIADLLGISGGTSKSQLFKARAKLRELLDPQPVRIEGEEAWST